MQKGLGQLCLQTLGKRGLTRAGSTVEKDDAPRFLRRRNWIHGHRFGLDFVVLQQAGGAGLAPIEHSADQLAAQRAGKGEFEGRQLVGPQAMLVGPDRSARSRFSARRASERLRAQEARGPSSAPAPQPGGAVFDGDGSAGGHVEGRVRRRTLYGLGVRPLPELLDTDDPAWPELA